MHEKRTVGRVNDLDTVNASNRLDNLAVMINRIGVNRYIPYDKALVDPNDVDRSNIAMRVTDGGCNFAEFSRLIADIDTKREAVACTRRITFRHVLDSSIEKMFVSLLTLECRGNYLWEKESRGMLESPVEFSI